MDRQTIREMLISKMNLRPDEHADLMEKYLEFVSKLNENQQRVVTRSLLTLEQARKTFGPHTRIEDIEDLVGPVFAAANSSCNGAQSAPLPTPPPHHGGKKD